MSQPVILKVYGNLMPCPEALARELVSLAACAMPTPEMACIARDGQGLLIISFEGIYFPCEEVLTAIGRALTPAMSGKLDILDLENWRLTRHLFANGRMEAHSAPLNNVLDYSGH